MQNLPYSKVVDLYIYERRPGRFSTGIRLALDRNQPGYAKLTGMLHHGVVSTAELQASGTNLDSVAELVAAGRLQKISRGWYATALAPPEMIRAVQLGGRLGCLSGCAVHGLWVPPDRSTHVILNPGRSIPRTEGVIFHRVSTPCHSAVASLEDCLAQVIRRHDPETALIVLESAIERSLMSVTDTKALIREAPVKYQRGLQQLRLGAGSGSETRVRLFFQRRNVRVRSQVFIPGVGSVDLVAGNSLIVESDSEAHHSRTRDYAEDRRRDLAARELGYETVRLSYHQIWTTWDQTQTVLAADLATGRHRRLPRGLVISR